MKSFLNNTIRRVPAFMREWHSVMAAAMLASMLGLGLLSMAGDSAIIDEVAHIPAAYSYLHFGDYRLNPEHPPLIKDLVGLPLQFMRLAFPTNLPAWTTEVNGQWEAGWSFLYHLGNDADAILFWSRLPILLLAVGFGVVLYRFCFRRYGVAVGLLALAFYAFSPNIIAHSRYVTTDLGASVFIFLALVAFVRYIERPNKTALLVLAIGLAFAQLAKFSAVLLVPFLIGVALVLIVIGQPAGQWGKRLKVYVGGLMAAFAAAFAIIWLWYVPNTMNTPPEVQDRLIQASLYDPSTNWVSSLLRTINDWPGFKGLAQYGLGVAMVFTRVSNGNLTYFNGEVTNQSFHWYFPELFALKTQVPFLILMVICVGAGLYAARRGRIIQGLVRSVRRRPMEWVLAGFAGFFMAVSIDGNLNLGIRHVLPVYIPLFVVVAVIIVGLMRRVFKTRYRTFAAIGLSGLMAWYIVSTVIAYPSYVSYFNELIGGGKNADHYFSDSSVDWGQDLIRFRAYVNQHPEIDRIALDYFGGGLPEYYFCRRTKDAAGNLIQDSTGYDCSGGKIIKWSSNQGRYTGQYIAVSETYLMSDIYYAAAENREGYAYLREREPVVRIGNSIYVYKLY